MAYVGSKASSSIQQKLDRIVDAYKNREFGRLDEEIVADVASYFCILLYGHLEVAIRSMMHAYAAKAGSRELSNFVDNQMRRHSNLHSRALSNLLEDFSSDWKSKINQNIQGRDGCKEALNALVFNRNRIAHGDCVDLRMEDLRQWKGHVDEVIAWVRDLLELPASGESQ